MLGKLIKHEFRATRRVMLPLYLVLLVTAVAANFPVRGLLDTSYWMLDVLGSLLIIFFAVAIVGVCVMSFVLMVQRFYKNLLQDEGYVMLTLPASIHQQIWAKLIVSAVWFVLTVMVVILASCVMAFDVGVIRDIFRGIGLLLQDLRELEAKYAFNGAGYLAELAVLCFVGLCAMCVQFYAALAIGHSAANHKMAWSVAAFFGLQFAVQMLWGVGIQGLISSGLSFHVDVNHLAAIHIGMLLMILAAAVYGAVFYVITAYFLKRRLNLE